MIYEHTDGDGDWIRLHEDGTVEVGGDDGESRRGQIEELYPRVALLHLQDFSVYGLEVEGVHSAPALLAKIQDEWASYCNDPEPAESDLKVRGVKRQWWLMPLDALAFAMQGGKFRPESLGDDLAAYQADPNQDTAAACVRAFMYELSEDQGTMEAALDLVVQVFEHGAAKYTPDNWRGAADDQESFRKEYLSAMCRHAFPLGGEIDPVEDGGSGLPHFAHGMCGGLMVLWHEMRWAREAAAFSDEPFRFPRVVHDDQADALSFAWRGIGVPLPEPYEFQSASFMDNLKTELERSLRKYIGTRLPVIHAIDITIPRRDPIPIMEAQGADLDRLGELHGVPRAPGATDNEYRAQITGALNE